MLQTLHIDLDTFLQDMDVNIAHFRHVIRQFSCHVGTFRDMEDEWSETQEKALRRDTHDCPICLSPLRSAEVVLLSCSHLLHQSCLRESELACQDRDATCPLCRSQYVSVPVPDSALLAYRTRYGS
ncbi:RING finger protein 32 [Silurus asotus]|uniref:RING finger protein 32 n=1 Tax=Silurus asotus TaxID=30991 RepID=A0AAD5FD93_SILAS|nr:RING finger protein 32 [Silurus asotus]